MSLPSRANDPRQRRAVGGQRNARDHRANEDFQDRSVQRSLSAGASNITAAKPGASDLRSRGP